MPFDRFRGASALQLRWVSSALLLWLLPGAAEARLNLPQLSQTVTLPAATQQQLRAAYRPTGRAPMLASPVVQRLLIAGLPAELRNACAEVVNGWGDLARGTGRWEIRGLHFERDGARLLHFLAFQCGSTLEDYKMALDERLAVLELDPTAARLRFFPFAEDCANCSELYQVDYSGMFPLERGRLLALQVSSTTENPCCDGPHRESRDTLLYLALPEVEPVLTLELQHTRLDHADVEGDQREDCHTKIDYATDAQDHPTEITATTTCYVNAKPQPPETRRYRWDATRRRWEPAPATQP